MHFRILLQCSLLSSLSPLSSAQTNWTNGGDGLLWSSSLNWSSGVPLSSSAVNIAVQPTFDIVALDTGATTVGSITFASSLVAGTDIAPLGGGDTLQVDGNISNLDNTNHSFSVQVTAGANATYAGGTGLAFSDLSIGTRAINTTGLLSVNNVLVFEIDSPAVFGSIGPIDASGSTISIGGTYTGGAGDSFDLTSGSFAGATLGSLPALDGGLTWDDSDFLSNGMLSVVPEPVPSWLLCLGFCLFFRRVRTNCRCLS